MKGGLVCHKHGGRAPQVKAAAARRVAEQEAGTHLGIPLDVEPHEAILDLVREAAGNVALLRGPGRRRRSRPAGVGLRRQALHEPDAGVLQRGARPPARFAKLASDMRIDETRVRLAQAQGQALALVVKVAVDACNPDDGERAAALKAAGEQMRAIRAGSALEVDG